MGGGEGAIVGDVGVLVSVEGYRHVYGGGLPSVMWRGMLTQ